VAIDKYMYLNVNTPILDDNIRIRYTKMETVRSVEQVEHTLARAALQHFGIDRGIEIDSIADIPAGTGLGSSSSYLVGLMNALHTLTQTASNPQSLAEEACHIELDVLKKPIGKQDQFMAAYGGLTMLDIAKDGNVSAEYLSIPTDVVEELENNLLLFYTGAVRDASELLSKQDEATRKKDQVTVRSLTEIKDIGKEITAAISKGNLRQVGTLMNTHWETKKRLSKGVTNSKIDAWYDLAMRNGAVGGKITGAGGGGFLMLYCEEKKAEVRKALRGAGLEELNFRFEFEGSKVVFDIVSRDGRLAHMKRHLNGKNHARTKAAGRV
jgi:D-glycero-alpha-D-manno-heptose-7-phosphate kinase